MTGLPFDDRHDAGRRLGALVFALGLHRPIVLGIPRGGVVVAAGVATATGGPLDVVVVRKLGAPGNPELAVGAVTADGDPYLDRRTIDAVRPSDDHLDREVEAQRTEARRRVAAYRGYRPAPVVTGAEVVVVDDGIATGSTVLAAGHLLRAREPGRLVLAVPVAPKGSVERVGAPYDDVVCAFTPEPYMAVGQWYRDFRQVSDDAVRSLLAG